MPKIELFNCYPLKAKISKKACEDNKKRSRDSDFINRPDYFFIADLLSCQGCKGLGREVVIDVSTSDNKRLIRTMKGYFSI